MIENTTIIEHTIASQLLLYAVDALFLLSSCFLTTVNKMNTLFNLFFDFITGILKNIGNIAAYSTCDFIMDEVEVPKELTQLHE